MIQYLIASKMVRKSWGLARRIINFDNRRSATAKEIANACRRNKNQTSNQIFKIKLLLPQGKNIDEKVHGNVVRQMRIGRRAIFPARCRDRQY